MRIAGEGQVVRLPEKDDNVVSVILAKAKRQHRKPRTDNHIHVSDLIGRCLRKKAIMHRDNVRAPSEYLSLMDGLTFRIGDAVHDFVKERATEASPTEVWGNWQCKCGKSKTTTPEVFSVVSKTVCTHCSTPMTEYAEVSMIDDELDIIGHPDLIFFLSAVSAFYVAELKSISAKEYDDLVRPKPDHILQVVMYWYLMRKAGYSVANKVSVLYVTKGYKFKGSPFTEFVIDAESVVSTGRIADLLEDARAFKAAKEGGELPLRTTCATPESTEAKKCEVCATCFGAPREVPTPVSFSEASRSAPNRSALRAAPLVVRRAATMPVASSQVDAAPRAGGSYVIRRVGGSRR